MKDQWALSFFGYYKLENRALSVRKGPNHNVDFKFRFYLKGFWVGAR